MRDAWERAEPPLLPRADCVAALLREAFAGATLLRFEATRAGLVNDNFRLELSGAAPRFALLRYWRRGQGEARREVALLRRLRPLLPVPEVMAVGEADPQFGLPFAVLEWMEGERLDLAAKGESGALAALGRAAGALLARVHGVRFERQGAFDESLSPAPGYDASVEGQLAWLASTYADSRAKARIGDALFGRLMDFVARRGEGLAAGWASAPCLTHGDYDPSNILVRRAAAGGFEAVAALDWEFAFAGGPAFDFGHLLRPPLGGEAAFMDALCRAYRDAGAVLPPDWREAARLADLLSWADFLAQPFCGEAAAASARAMIERLSGAPHAAP